MEIKNENLEITKNGTGIVSFDFNGKSYRFENVEVDWSNMTYSFVIDSDDIEEVLGKELYDFLRYYEIDWDWISDLDYTVYYKEYEDYIAYISTKEHEEGVFIVTYKNKPVEVCISEDILNVEFYIQFADGQWTDGYDHYYSTSLGYSKGSQNWQEVPLLQAFADYDDKEHFFDEIMLSENLLPEMREEFISFHEYEGYIEKSDLDKLKELFGLK
ncbi:MAG: hypothetical protein ACOC3V_04390 [bacterium]